MRKYLPRTVVALFTFAVGIIFVNFAALFYAKIDLPKVDAIELKQSAVTAYPTDSKGEIEVRFKSYGQIKKQPTLIFEIINHHTESVKYWSRTESPDFPYIKFNNREQEVFVCGTGMKEFELKPGSSIRVEFIVAHFLYEYLDKKGELQIGFYLKKGQKQYKKIWSEKFSVSDEMKREIISRYRTR